jgi:hypothetical protein
MKYMALATATMYFTVYIGSGFTGKPVYCQLADGIPLSDKFGIVHGGYECMQIPSRLGFDRGEMSKWGRGEFNQASVSISRLCLGSIVY